MTSPLKNIPKLRPIWIVAFSGHRPSDSIAGRSSHDIRACKENLKQVFSDLRAQAEKHGGSIELICSLAEGSDLLAIEVADEMDLPIPVHLILPLPPESFRNDYKDKNGVMSEHWDLVQKYISRGKDPLSAWTVRVAIGDNTRPDCYHETNHQMLESADVLVSICLGNASKFENAGSSSESSLGGTSEVIHMADANHFDIPTIVLDPSKHGEVYRNDPWVINQSSFEMIQKLNADLESVEAKESRNSYQRDGQEEVWTVHQAFDNVANNQGRRFRRCFEQSVWLHFGATALAAIAATFAALFHKNHLDSTSIALTFIELLLVVVATIFVLKAQKKSTNSIWLRNRFAAELVDSQIHSALFIDPLRPVSMKHNETWKRFALVIALSAHRQVAERLAYLDNEETFIELKSNYLTSRVIEQSQYLSAKQKAASSRFHLSNRVAYYASVLALLVISVALITKSYDKHLTDQKINLSHSEQPHSDVEKSHKVIDKNGKNAWFKTTYIYFLPILFPMIAGLSSSLIVASDSARRASRFKQVGNRLDKLERIIPTVRTFSAMQPLVIEVEDEILDEMIEWFASAQNLDHMH